MPQINPSVNLDNLTVIERNLCVIHDDSQVIAEIKGAVSLGIADGYGIFCPSFGDGELVSYDELPDAFTQNMDGMAPRGGSCSYDWTRTFSHGVVIYTSWTCCTGKPCIATGVHMCVSNGQGGHDCG